MQKSYRKNIRRDFRSNLNRFLSLFGIVALGVMMLTGLVSFAPSMRTAGQKYYVQQNVFDLRVLSTLGLSESDLSAIAATEGVSAVMPVKYLDTEGRWSSSTDGAVLRVQQLPADPAADTEANMNRLTLLEGRMPETANECVVQVLGHADPVPLGTVVTLPEDTEDIRRTEYTVVGQVQDPQYFSANQETSTVGDGILDALVFVQDGELTADYYTVCYLKVADAAQYDNYSDEYQTAVDTVADRLDAISKEHCVARRAQLIEDATTQLDDAKQTYSEQKAEAERQFAQAEQKLTDAQRELDAAKAQLDAGEAELAAQKAALPDTMQSGAATLVSSEEQVLEFEDQLQQIQLLVNLKQVADPLLGYAETALNNAQKALDESEPEDEEYTELRDALAKAQAAYDNIKGQLDGYQAQLNAGKQQMYAKGLISSPNLSNTDLVTEAKAALRKMKVQLLQGQLQLSTGTATAYTQFEAARAQLDEGWAQYQSGQEQLDASRTEYETQKADAEQKLAEGQQQINDAEEKIADIQNGEWYVLDRGSTLSLVTLEQYADRMAAIARVFPVFFFLVAALVASTTMTRMVDENRLQMGTLKALGYSNVSIAGKYLLYGIAASVLGSIVGIAVGFVVFPTIFWYAYRTMMFSIPTFTLHFYPGLALGSMALSAAVIGLATLQACRASLKEKSAALLLPRAPVAGKRILLEYLTPLWKRMSFSQKTTARNLFRYKKRFFMTVLGVAGCTALLLIGFGIQDSLLPMLTKQTTELTHADLTISLSDEKALTMENGLADLLDSSSGITSWGRYYTKSVTLYNAEGEKETVSLVAAADESQMTEYFTFRTRQGHKAIAFDDSSVILTEKTAEKLGLSVGDSFEVETADGGRRSLTLTGITENYVFTRLYLSQAQLKTLNGGALPAWNAVYGQTDCPTDTARASLSSAILACNYVSSVSFIEDTTQMFDGLIGCLNYVVMLVIVCAAALAAVVLYNLISVNLGERKKELATIKVLGFYDKEVYRYIFREIDLLSLIGSLVGLVVGIPLHQFIIRTVEMDQMMFIRSIAPRSFVFSVALTMLFNFAVCLLMRRHVRQISMVESMKAPE